MSLIRGRARSITKILLLFAAGWLQADGHAYGQLLHADGQRPSFEVATIKPSDPDPKGALPFGGLLVRNCEISVRSIQVKKIIGWAYDIPPSVYEQRIIGGPGWINTSAYDIDAKAEDQERCRKLSPALQNRRMRLMMQFLLADRFKLQVRMETRQGRVYALQMIKTGQFGPRLRPHPTNLPCPPASTPLPNQDSLTQTRLDELSKDLPCDVLIFMQGSSAPANEGFQDAALNMTAGEIANIVANFVYPGAVGLDQTGVSGTYDFMMKFYEPPGAGALMDSIDGSSAPPSQQGGSPTLQEALKEQLGLKLVTTNGPLQVLVIDHIDRPSEN